MAKGKVYLVGAGPGHPELITRRAVACLAAAEVVVYDRLIGPSVLELAPPRAERVYVGKEGGRHALSQPEINALLVRLGQEGRVVVRLKGGDPYLFGRGGEEALALLEAGLDFEVVPGVTSAIAAPAYAGIPVTHRGLASSLAIVTGHEDPEKDETALRWAQLATATDTLVFLMAMENLESIVERLLEHGRPGDEPAALVRWGTTPEQETLTARLDQLVDRAREAGLRPPAVLVVGRVVALRPQLAWYDRLPLRGARVLVTRSREQASGLAARLRELGASPIEFPTIAVQPVEAPSELDQALSRVGDFDWVIFTSANGVSAAFERLDHLGLDARAFAGARLCAIGPATAEALRTRGLRADWVPEQFTSAAILEGFRGRHVAGQRVLLARADIAPPDLARGLEALGAEVRNVVAYRTVAQPADDDVPRAALAEGRVDVVTCTSSSTVRNLVQALNGRTDLLERPMLACIGPVTARTARELGLRVDVEASVHTIEGLVEALVAAWHRQS
ncbi:MAG: uroporphyrinogen-III C-methyltransferase [Chloroflexi bacterium]|nr:uroporphyrinogen-III C-methyltransferase [Chloroflexota bacterium]